MPRRAAQFRSGAVDEPNVILPLATSYNERGVAGYTHTVTNSEDQRKVNSLYEIAKNAATGKGTLTYSKRPGVTVNTETYGLSTQISYIALDTNRIDSSIPPIRDVAVFNTTVSGGNTTTNAALTLTGGGANTAIAIVNGGYPRFVDVTSIGSPPVLNIVVQISLWTSSATRDQYWYLPFGGAWTRITDGDFLPTTFDQGKMEHMDGYAFILDENNLIWNSDSNSLANWALTSFLAKGIQQDRATGLARLGNKLLAFGDNTAEVYYNAGNTNTVGSPLGRIIQLANKVGLVPTVKTATTVGAAGGTHYYATQNGRIFFVGRRAGQGASVGMFSFDGTTFDKVSSPYIDKILSEKYNAIYSVNAIGVNGKAGIAVCLTAPSATTQISLVFFPEWNDWFEWTSTIFSPVNGGGYHIGVAQTHKIFTFTSSDNWQDNGTSYPFSTQFKIPTNGSSTSFLEMYGVDADIDTSTNDLTVEISPDGLTFSTLGTIDQTQDRKVLFEGGSFTKAWIRLGNTNARPTRIHNFLARIS